MKNAYLSSVLFFLLTLVSYGQNENNHWVLGTADLNFANNPASVTTVANSGNYGMASISDTNGNLLFYTDGYKVWNKNHAVMQNGGQICGSGSVSGSAVPAVIIPFPGNDKKYFIVSTGGEAAVTVGSTNYHYTYSLVDFTTNSLGEVIILAGNANNYSNSTSRFLTDGTNRIGGDGWYKPLTVAKKSDNSGYWVVVMNYKSIMCFEITAAGFNETPVISDLSATVINGYTYQTGVQAQFKMSPDNTKIGGLDFTRVETDFTSNDPANYKSMFYTLDFNSLTGQCTNFSVKEDAIGAKHFENFEFSADSQKVYFVSVGQYYTGAGAGYYRGEIFVKDLNSLGTASRKLAELGLPTSYPSNFSYLQRDKNGNILITSKYADLNRNKNVHRIENQDSFATASVKTNWIYLNGYTTYYGLPQLILNLQAPCVTNLTVTANVTTGIDKKQASSTIVASNTISSGAGAIYHAGNSVTLVNGFRAVSGSAFRAYIEGCTGTYVGKMNSEAGDDLVSNDESIVEASRLYPNPNNGNFTINVGQKVQGEINITIYNIYGAQVQRSVQRQATFDIDASNLPAGLYVVKLEGNNYNETLKFIRK